MERIMTRTSHPVTTEIIPALRERMRGPVLQPGETGYDEARRIWNGMINKRPELIARCTGTADVVAAVNFAREYELVVSVRGGGHSVAGHALCEGGLMIDLSWMRGIWVDPAARTAIAQPGICLGDLDHETQAWGLATPTGIVSETGIAGLTLGGGFGWLSRKYGLTVDNLRAVQIVTADGQLRRASAQENPDLFWAVRGGGGNFGVVTAFEYQLHPVGPLVMAGMTLYSLSEAPRILDFYRRFSMDAPDELSVLALMRIAPPAPFLPPEIHGKPVVGLATCYVGSVEEGERAVQPIRGLGQPLVDLIKPKPFAIHQTMLDSASPKGRHYYWKTEYFDQVSDGAQETLIHYANRFSSPFSAILLFRLGGAISRVDEQATAAGQRDAGYILNIQCAWEDAQETQRHTDWTQEFWQAIHPYGMGGAYTNFMSSDEGEPRVRAAYRANYDRLQRVKQQYDPHNLFRINHNIRPEG